MSRVAGRGRRALMLAVVVAGLLVGLVGMHHLPVAPAPDVAPVSHVVEDPSAGSGDPAPPHGGGDHESGLLHLCLAVLTAIAVLIAFVVGWRRTAAGSVVRQVAMSRPRTAPRAPPPTAPARLALLCVLRT